MVETGARVWLKPDVLGAEALAVGLLELVFQRLAVVQLHCQAVPPLAALAVVSLVLSFQGSWFRV